MTARLRAPWRLLVSGLLLSGLLAGAIAVMTMMTMMRLAPMRHGSRDRDVAQWETSWSNVLMRHVDARGRVDFSGLRKDRGALDEVVQFIAAVDPASSPAQFPTPDDRKAYYLNAYNALAMDGVVDAGVPKRLGWWGRIKFFLLRKFTMGGKAISLYSLENKIIRPLGDPRVHFALNCMSVSCPRLPRIAFTAAELDEQLDAAAREFVAEPRNVAVDDTRKELHLSAIFKFYTGDFLARAPSLTAYINQYRTIPVPEDYKIIFNDYDWTINDQNRQ